ncbi:hypothetical protein [Rathayibacter sp. VKM Ac-2857]
MSAIEALPFTQAGTDDTDLTTPKKAPKASKGATKRTLGDWAILIVAVVIGLVIISPVLLILLNSFKTPAE